MQLKLKLVNDYTLEYYSLLFLSKKITLVFITGSVFIHKTILETSDGDSNNNSQQTRGPVETSDGDNNNNSE